MMWLMGLLSLTVVTSVVLIDSRKQNKSDTYTVVAVEREKK
jgi:hypothetical protein